MKLLLCPKCQDVVKLKIGYEATCACGASHGMYIDELNAEYGGEAIPIGFANNSLVAALEERDRQMRDGTEANARLGITFDAFFIPTGAPSVKMKDGVKTIFSKRPKTEQEKIIDYMAAVTKAHAAGQH